MDNNDPLKTLTDWFRSEGYIDILAVEKAEAELHDVANMSFN
jgi:hypothetical protein